MKKINYFKNNILYVLFLLMPFINLITGLMSRNNQTITIGIIIRLLLLIYLGLFIIFKSSGKTKKYSLIYYFILAIYIILKLVINNSFSNIHSLFIELNYIFKFIYYPVLIIGLYNYNDLDKTRISKILLANLVIYLLFMIFPILTGSSYFSYGSEQKGFVGWFYAANELAPIMLLLFPTLFMLLNQKQFKLYLILTFLSIFSIVSIRTKVSIIGLGIIIISYLFFKLIFKNKRKNIKYIFITLIMYLCLISSPMTKIYEKLEYYNGKDNATVIIPESSIGNTQFETFINKILSNRSVYLKRTNQEYLQSNLNYKLMGISFLNENNRTTLIEMDFLDIFYHFGLIGFIIILMPYLFFLILILKRLIKNFNLSNLYGTNVLFLITFIAFIAGHTFSSPAASTFIALYTICLLKE